MTLFLTYPLNLKNEKVYLTSWSNTEIPVLAAVSDSKKIFFYQDEASLLEGNILVKEKQITAIAWHTDTLALVYGFDNGDLGVWIDSNNLTKDDYSFHEGKVTNVKFNLHGNKVVSSDDKFVINVSFFDGTLTKLCTYHQSLI